jgi:hypothetical protein
MATTDVAMSGGPGWRLRMPRPAALKTIEHIEKEEE